MKLKKIGMKKIGLFLGGIILSVNLVAQTVEFTLNKALVVGCYNAHALTDITKKVTVVMNGEKATMKYANFNCKKELEYLNFGSIDAAKEAVLYFNEKEKKGFIIEKNEKIIILAINSEKFEIASVGHIDKKIAKTISVESENQLYSSVFANMNSVIAQGKAHAKANAKAAEMAEKMAKAPTTEYIDEYGISGVYYLSKVMLSTANSLDSRGYASISDERYFSQVSFQLDTTKRQLLIHYHEGKSPIEAFIDGMVVKGLKTGAANFDYLPFSIDNVSRVVEDKGSGLNWNDKIIQPLEKDVYIINYGGYGVDVALDCSSAKSRSEKDKSMEGYVILGKSKARVEEIYANPALFQSLYIASCIEQCELYNRCRASSNTLPVETLKDAKLKAEALAFAKAEQANSTRNEKVEYAYIAGKDWNYTRHIKTGVIIKRSIRTITIVKIGVKCAYENGVITQNYDGAKYGPSIWGGNGAPIITDCKEAYKYK